LVLDGRGKSVEQRRAIDERAAQLYLKARSSDSPDDWAEAYRWVEEDPAHGVAFAKADASWDLTERLREVNPRVAPEAIAGPAGRFEAMFGDRAIAMLIATAVIGTVLTVGIQKWVDVDRYRTAVGEKRIVRLRDGSVIQLNTDSAVEVALSKDQRFVRLLRGEARFDVMRNTLNPFVVQTGATTMRALGTAFNVRLRPELTELTVIAGQVAVRDGEQPAQHTVSAGTGAAIRSGAVAITTLGQSQIAQRTAWERGLLSFKADTLAQAVEEFNRYRSAPVIIGDPQLAALRIDGTFRAESSDGFIQGLARDHGIRAVLNTDQSVILLPRAN